MTHNVAKMALGRCASFNCNSIVMFLVNDALIFQKKKNMKFKGSFQILNATKRLKDDDDH